MSTFLTARKSNIRSSTGGIWRKWLSAWKLALRWNIYCECHKVSLPQGGSMKSILDPSFRYTKSVETDLRKTFARVRREMRRQQAQQQSTPNDGAMRKVVNIHAR